MQLSCEGVLSCSIESVLDLFQVDDNQLKLATNGSDDSFPHVALAVMVEFSHHSLQSLDPINQPSLLGDEFEQQFFNSRKVSHDLVRVEGRYGKD